MILILTEAGDEHADHLVPMLQARGAQVVRFDPAVFPAEAELSVSGSADSPFQATLRAGGREYDLEQLGAIWYRRPNPPVPPASMTDPAVRRFTQTECRWFAQDAWHGLACPWVPGPPMVVHQAQLKASQLRVAAALGFEIPPTLFTNSPDRFLEFYRSQAGDVISKSAGVGFDEEFGATYRRYTEPVSKRDLGYAGRVRHCPVIFQAYVPKQVELRVTVVGERVFAAEIHSQATRQTRHDWRRYDRFGTRYQPHLLPEALSERCVALTRQLGLRYSAIDLVLTPDGRYVFLELNSSGQYLWVEGETGLPISEALCDLLLSPSASTGDRQPASNPPQPTVTVARAAAPPGSLGERWSPVEVDAHEVGRGERRPAMPDGLLDRLLSWQMRLCSDAVRPEAAMAECRALRRRAGAKIDLVWEQEGFDGAVHYDALLFLPGQGTVSLSFCGEQALPWPLRGARRWSDQDLLRVNETTMEVGHAVACLDVIWDGSGLAERLINTCLIQEALAAEPVELSADQLQEAMDAFRRARGLLGVAETHRWLAERGLTHTQLERMVRDEAAVAALRARVAAGQVEAHFAAHRADWDWVRMACLEFESEASARRALAEMEGGDLEFYAAAERQAAGANGAPALFATLRRGEAPPGWDTVFAARPGALVGPLPRGGRGALARVLAVGPACLDRATRVSIERQLFAAWLAKQRRAARIEWFWGSAERTARATAAGPAGDSDPPR